MKWREHAILMGRGEVYTGFDGGTLGEGVNLKT
jgi:hypothetical protein